MTWPITGHNIHLSLPLLIMTLCFSLSLNVPVMPGLVLGMLFVIKLTTHLELNCFVLNGE